MARVWPAPPAVSSGSLPAEMRNAGTIRVMVVDDSAVARTLMRRWLADEGIQVVLACRTGREAIESSLTPAPDVVILDIEMPDMDGVEALPILIKKWPGAAIIMASSLTRRNAEVSLRCLSIGAVDYLPKPDATNSTYGLNDFQHDLIAKVKVYGARGQRYGETGKSVSVREVPQSRSAFSLRSYSRIPLRAIAIGASTGGPQALAELLGVFKAKPITIPIFITQHMPPNFTTVLAAHIGAASGLPSAEGVDGTPALPGHIYVAPGGYHMVVQGSNVEPVIRINRDPAINFCRPAVDPLFESLSRLYGPSLLAVVLTGMGSDGVHGASLVAHAGGTVIAQDEASSVVWGMPGQTAQSGVCAAVLPLASIGAKILSLLSGVAHD